MSVFGGFALVGGHLGALLQPVELLMIGGAATGAFFVGNTGKAIKATLKSLPKTLQGPKYDKAIYMELMALLYELLNKVRKEGLMSIEGDVEEPAESALFAKYPKVAADHHVVEFMTDYLRIMVSGNLNAMEIENLMDIEIATHLEQKAMEGTKIFNVIKVTLLANLNGYAPAMAVEFGRKVLDSTERPGFAELEEHVKQKR